MSRSSLLPHTRSANRLVCLNTCSPLHHSGHQQPIRDVHGNRNFSSSALGSNDSALERRIGQTGWEWVALFTPHGRNVMVAGLWSAVCDGFVALPRSIVRAKFIRMVPWQQRRIWSGVLIDILRCLCMVLAVLQIHTDLCSEKAGHSS